MRTQLVILITGCSSGFGLLTAARLASRGHFVYATMRDISKQQALLDEVRKHEGQQILVRPLDVTSPNTIQKVVEEIKERHGHIDVLVNNAGFGLGGFFEDLTQDEIRQQMEVNFFGAQNVTRACLPLMRPRQKGKIINISSISGQMASPGFGAYNASKWALEGFSESLYHELDLFGIRVVLVEPGSYPTKIFFENARYAKDFHDTKSPYYKYSQKLKNMVDAYIDQCRKDPQDVAALIERIINTDKPRLRYVSDWPSWFNILLRKIMPTFIYNYFFRKILYGNPKHTV